MSLRAAYIPEVHNIGTDIASRQGLRPGGIEAPPRGGGVDMKGVRPGTSGSVCILRDVSLSTLVFPHAYSSSWTGRNGADVAEASTTCISPNRSAPRSPGDSSPGPGSTTFHCPRWPGRVWFPDIISLLIIHDKPLINHLSVIPVHVLLLFIGRFGSVTLYPLMHEQL